MADYVFESPDGGKTMYRKEVGNEASKVLVGNTSHRPLVPGTKTAIVLGAGGFIGGHLVKRLVKEGYWVRGVDVKYPEYDHTAADDFLIGDLRDPCVVDVVVTDDMDDIYQLAADMGGAGFVFTGEHDFDIMHNSSLINLNVIEKMTKIAPRRKAAGSKKQRVFYSSSACMYPEYNQRDPNNPQCSEDSAYPAAPDSEYGWEKLFSERMFLAAARNYGLEVRIARFHNIFGPYGTWDGGREKAPAAFCRKVILCPHNGQIEMWGDGEQTRSFLFVDECVEGIRRLFQSDFTGPVNIGSEEMVTINQLATMASDIMGKKITIKHIPGPLGVRGRNSDNKLIQEKLGWQPNYPLRKGMEVTLRWIEEKVKERQ